MSKSTSPDLCCPSSCSTGREKIPWGCLQTGLNGERSGQRRKGFYTPGGNFHILFSQFSDFLSWQEASCPMWTPEPQIP